MQKDLLIKAQELRKVVTLIATGANTNNEGELYINLRSELFSNRVTKNLLPSFIIACRTPMDLWDFIQPLHNTYKGRRVFIREQFDSLLASLESEEVFPHDEIISDSVTKFDCDTVARMWEKALDRRTIDPDGAITAARSLIESVCKQILIERNTTYEDSYDLPKLFKVTAKCLNLAPELHNDNVIKQILGGIQTTIYGFSALRNALSDAHGQPKGGYKANTRHAEFAVNLAGSTASFLIQTHHETITNGASVLARV